MKAVQTAFWSRRTQHGGEVGKRIRKVARPIATKRAMHVTLRSEMARGKYSLLRKENARFVDKTIALAGRRWGVKVYEQANVGNHLHLLLKAHTRAGFSNFLRVLAGKIAMYVTGAARGNALSARFWNLTAWSRIVETDYPEVRAYVVQNRLEGEGVIAYVPRK